MNVIHEKVRQVVRGPAVARVLQGLGIDATRYWLLMDLFGKLSERREILNQLGRDGITLKVSAWLYCAFSSVLSLVAVLVHTSLEKFFWAFLAMGAFILLSVLLSETSNSLVNPVEGLVLAHQPIDGATYSAAKLSHLLRILLYLIPGLNAVPAFAALLLPGTPWFYPLLHLLAACIVGLVVALLCCALFGWLIRFVPSARLKTVGQVAETLPWLGFMSYQFVRDFVRDLQLFRWLSGLAPYRGYLLVVFAIASVWIVAMGLRALSADYLVRVASIAHGGSHATARVRSSPLGEVVSRWFGGPPGRAGFDYVSHMMFRDWSFRRQLIPLIPMTLAPALTVVHSWRVSPFSGGFSALHLMPHIFGTALFMMCTMLPYGTDYKGAWMFLLAPAGAFRDFTRGVHAMLWLRIVLLPHIILLPLFAWAWGVRDAILFVGYSAAAASFYLGLEFRMIEGVPFARQVETSRGAYMLPIMLVGGLGISIAVALQYFLVFRSIATVFLTTLAIAAGAYYLTRNSLGVVDVAMRHHLGILSAETGAIYKEIEA